MDLLEGVDCRCGISAMGCARCLCCLCTGLPAIVGRGIDFCCLCVCSGVCVCSRGFCIACLPAGCLATVGGGKKKLTFAMLLLTIFISYSIILSGFHLYSGFSFSIWRCSPRLTLHLIFQGFSLINFSLLSTWLVVKYYYRSKRTLHRVAAFAFFWTTLRKDTLLLMLLTGVAFGVIWAILGLVWLSRLDCELDSREVAVSNIGSVSFLVMSALFLSWVVVLFVLLACNEGSCTNANVGPFCFLCCCYICIRQRGKDISAQISGKLVEARSLYPKHRSVCLEKVTNGLVALGLIRPDLAVSRYERHEEESSIQELDGRVIPIATGTAADNHPTTNSEASVMKPPILGS